MGIARGDAELGVRQTGANSVEAAISWVFENRESASRDRLEEEGIYQEFKMVFCVNGSLAMSPGKMAAQVGHGVIDLYRNLVSNQEEFGGPLLQWIENGSKKVVLRCDNDTHLTALATKCRELGLPHSVITDAGLTEIPAGSQTVLSIFGVSSNVDKVSGKLSLL
jgi:PTH2 family peptidyl-tRNA hydrolase